jgi:F-type H+/Na+-transporting ATPase subunit alpha
MIPIGRGQRELIIGDRQTGKTAGHRYHHQPARVLRGGQPVYCIYVAIGQKGSTVAGTVKTLGRERRHGLTPWWPPASDPAPMQFFAPFTGAAIGEFFRDTGRPALIVFDDLVEAGRGLPRSIAAAASSSRT